MSEAWRRRAGTCDLTPLVLLCACVQLVEVIECLRLACSIMVPECMGASGQEGCAWLCTRAFQPSHCMPAGMTPLGSAWSLHGQASPMPTGKERRAAPSSRPLPPNSRKRPPTAVSVWPDLGQGPCPVVQGSSHRTDCKPGKCNVQGGLASAGCATKHRCRTAAAHAWRTHGCRGKRATQPRTLPPSRQK